MGTTNNQLKSKIKFITGLPSKLFLGLFILCSLISVMALRGNNQTMVELRDAVYEADKNSGDVSLAVNNLRRHVYAHMNTNLSSGGNAIKPPLQLKYTYERLQQAEKQRVDTVNEKIYTEAQGHCERQNPASFSGGGRVPCIEEYVSRNGAQPNKIPAGLYQFDFISPSWSPDLAGWSLILSGIFVTGFVSSFALEKLVKQKLRP